MKERKNIYKRILAVCLISILVLSQYFVIQSDVVRGQSDFEIRVQYQGERDDKIRTVAVFSENDLKSIGAGTYYYSSITSIGTIMQTLAYGPRLSDVIAAAGIDIDSVDYVVFRTDDGSGLDGRFSINFSKDKIVGERWSYPNLAKNYDQNIENRTIIPKNGALSGGKKVPSVLAIKSFSTKYASVNVSESKMNYNDSYRFCLGTAKLTEGKASTRGQTSSWESLKYIFGMDVILKGYPPVRGIKLSAIQEGLSIGSQTQIKASISGGAGLTESDLDWSSSDESVASVSNSGLLTINGEGTATISAKASNGITATMTVTVQGKTVQKEVENPDFNPDLEEGEGNSRTMVVEETEYAVSFDYNDAKEEQKVVTKPLKKVSISEKHQVVDIKKPETISAKQVKLSSIPVESSQPQRADNTAALEKAEEYGPKTKAIAGGIGAGLFAIGAGLRIRRFYLEK